MKKQKLTPPDVAALYDLECVSQPIPWSKENIALELRRNPSCSFSWVGVDETGKWATYVLARQVMDELWILQVGTAPDFRRQGLAQELLSWVMAQAEAVAEIQKVILEVREHNTPAIELYGALGFVQEGLRPKYYPPVRPDAPRENAILMGRALRP